MFLRLVPLTSSAVISIPSQSFGILLGRQLNTKTYMLAIVLTIYLE